MKLVIGLCGRARHGKDLVAAEMKSQFEARGQRCFLLPISQLIFEEAAGSGMVAASTRETCTLADIDALVLLGRLRRSQNEDYWVDRLSERVDRSFADVALITGIRLENEVAWLRMRYGVLVRVLRWDGHGMYISPDRNALDPLERDLENLGFDHLLCAHSGDERWLKWQATNLANYLFKTRCQDDVSVGAHGASLAADGGWDWR